VEKHGEADLERCAEEAEACAEDIECLLERCMLVVGQAKSALTPYEVNVVLMGRDDGIVDDFAVAANVFQIGESQGAIRIGQQAVDPGPIRVLVRTSRPIEERGVGGEVVCGHHMTWKSA
jgi:hypothetical protein